MKDSCHSPRRGRRHSLPLPIGIDNPPRPPEYDDSPPRIKSEHKRAKRRRSNSGRGEKPISPPPPPVVHAKRKRDTEKKTRNTNHVAKRRHTAEKTSHIYGADSEEVESLDCGAGPISPERGQTGDPDPSSYLT